MCADEEGFLYPVISTEKCISCGKCKRVCPCLQQTPLMQEWKTRAFVVRIKDEAVLTESTSGGGFSAIARQICDEGGVVIGAAFDEEFHIVHKVTSNYRDISKFRGSKYAQSELGETFSDIKRLLQQGEVVLFSGTPCQVAGVKKYLGKNYKNLYTIDIVCRSIPSPKLWNEFIKTVVPQGVKQVRFRNKTYGYHSGTFIVEFKNGKIISSSNRVNKYMKAFHMNICSRPSCYDCKFKSVERVSDFTLFDCWHPEKLINGFRDDDKGYTGCLVHSNKGLELLENIKTWTWVYNVDVKKALSFTGGMAEHSVIRPIVRSEFYTTLTEIGAVATLDRYVSVNLKDKFIECTKMFLYKTKLLKQVKKVKSLLLSIRGGIR